MDADCGQEFLGEVYERRVGGPADNLRMGDVTVADASVGLVMQASVNLTGASCDGIFVRSQYPCLTAVTCHAGRPWGRLV
jgi:hypothetical protein